MPLRESCFFVYFDTMFGVARTRLKAAWRLLFLLFGNEFVQNREVVADCVQPRCRLIFQSYICHRCSFWSCFATVCRLAGKTVAQSCILFSIILRRLLEEGY